MRNELKRGCVITLALLIRPVQETKSTMKYMFIFDGKRMTKQEIGEIFSHKAALGWIRLEGRTKDSLIEDIEDVVGEKIEGGACWNCGEAGYHKAWCMEEVNYFNP